MSTMDNPPVESAEFHEPPGWPVTLGILSCVWGGLTFLVNGCCQLGSTLLGYAFLSKMPPEQADQFNSQMAMVGVPGYALLVVQTILAMLLIVAAISLIRRTRTGAMLHLAYGIIGILVVLLSAAWGIVKADDVAASMLKNPNMQQGGLAKLASIGKNGIILMTIILGFVRLAYPVFCLIWFGKVKYGADLGRIDHSDAI